MARNDDNNAKDNGEKLEAPPGFEGPTDHRRCTDLLMLVLITAMWAAMTYIGVYSILDGDYRKILYPLDYDGNICGTSFGPVDMTEYPNIVYINNFLGGVCVKDCPRVSDFEDLNVTDVRTLITYSGIFQVDGAILPKDFIEVADYSNAEGALECTKELCYPNDDPALSFVSDGVNSGSGYAYYAGDTVEAVRRCYYTKRAKEAILQQVNADGKGLRGLDFTDNVAEFFSKLYADAYTARRYILGFGFGFSLAVGFVYIFLMRVPFLLALIVWSSLFIANAIFYVGGYYAWAKAQEWDGAEPQTVGDTVIKATRIGAMSLFSVGALITILACCLRSQIMISIGCVKVAGKAINHMFALLLVPVIQAVGLVLFTTVWVVYAVHLASLSDISKRVIPLRGDVDITVRGIATNDFVVRSGWYLLFCLYWTANFVGAVGDMVIALSVSKYFFARVKWRIGSWTVVASVFQVLFYHSGTCAFGSLLIGIVQITRTLIARAQRAAKKVDSKAAKVILCCCQCCFCMLEACLKFVSKNAYIQAALFSTPFCRSCRSAFLLIARNAGRITAISYVSSAVLIVGRLFISAVTTLGGYYLITEDLTEELHSTAGPIVIIFLISYWLSEFFMDIFDITITCVLHCFVADEEMFPENPHSDKDLQGFIDKHGSATS